MQRKIVAMVFSCLVLLFGVFQSITFAQVAAKEQTNYIYVKVKDAADNPLPNTTIKILWEGQEIVKRLTDENGEYCSDDLVLDKYTVKAWKQDYIAEEQEVKLSFGDPLVVKFIMKKEVAKEEKVKPKTSEAAKNDKNPTIREEAKKEIIREEDRVFSGPDKTKFSLLRKQSKGIDIDIGLEEFRFQSTKVFDPSGKSLKTTSDVTETRSSLTSEIFFATRGIFFREGLYSLGLKIPYVNRTIKEINRELSGSGIGDIGVSISALEIGKFAGYTLDINIFRPVSKSSLDEGFDSTKELTVTGAEYGTGKDDILRTGRPGGFEMTLGPIVKIGQVFLKVAGKGLDTSPEPVEHDITPTPLLLPDGTVICRSGTYTRYYYFVPTLGYELMVAYITRKVNCGISYNQMSTKGTSEYEDTITYTDKKYSSWLTWLLKLVDSESTGETKEKNKISDSNYSLTYCVPFIEYKITESWGISAKATIPISGKDTLNGSSISIATLWRWKSWSF
ncbi:MAG: carboxypeptidase-like regulatory domain-containing protein [Elusimicrobiota bacterium]